MSASLDTLDEAAQYDAERTMAGFPNELFLYGATPETGLQALTANPISSGWFPQRERDQIEGTQFLAVRIAETDENLAVLTPLIMSQVAALGIAGLRYKIKDKIDPFEEPRVWMMKCSPTGEVVEA